MSCLVRDRFNQPDHARDIERVPATWSQRRRQANKALRHLSAGRGSVDMVDPASISLPNFLNPLLDYLKDNLPPPLYSLLLSLSSHALAILTSIFSLLYSLINKHPSEWDAQTFFPPIIAVLTGYLALASLYRTTSWMFRTSVWFVKWSTVIAALLALAGSVLRASSGDLSFTGVASSLADVITGMLDDATRPQKTRGQRKSQSRPKAWQSYDQHRDWQYKEEQEAGRRSPGQREATDAERTVEDFVSDIEESGLWKMAQGFFSTKQESEGDKAGKRGKTQTR